ncbi:MAG: GNAT family N-acetyltransferase [Anaerolineales bacterium]|nr:GNAT family N-acetyltransferase [Anaerolineales bacterium]
MRPMNVPPTAVFPLVSFRLLQPDDLHALHQACFAERPLNAFRRSFAQLLRRHEAGRGFCLVAQTPTGLIGSGQLTIYPNGAELANLIVVPAWRGQGVGTGIIVILTAVADHLQLPCLEIGVQHDNPRAQALYERLGFIPDRPLDLPNRPPATILRKQLAPKCS